MATHQISILTGNTIPDNTGRCWAETYDVVATNDVWKPLVFRFLNPAPSPDQGPHGIYGAFTVPQNYVGSAVIVPKWTSTATSGNCRWRFTYRAVSGDDTESLDQTSNQEQVLLTDAAPTAANRLLQPTGMALTSANLAVADTVEFLFERIDDSGTDTMAADAILFDLLLQYADA